MNGSRYSSATARLAGGVFAFAALVATVLPALADNVSAPVVSERVTADILTDAQILAPGASANLALRLQTAPGWHTYWSNPGDSGAATSIEWTLPAGVETTAIVWPAPVRLPYGPLMNYGYEDEVWHLVGLNVPADWPVGEPVRLEAEATWLVCADICIPESGSFSLDIPTGPSANVDPASADAFALWQSRVPTASPYNADIAASGDVALLTIAGSFDAGAVEDVYFFPNSNGVLDHAGEQVWSLTETGIEIALPPGQATLNDPGSSEIDGVLAVTEVLGSRSFTSSYQLSAPVEIVAGAALSGLAVAPDGFAAAPLGLALAGLFAFLGGVLLNLMPCVFPILSIKALALMRQENRESSALRPHGLAYTAGVSMAFLAIAGVLVALRAGGAQIGWGFQLQSPVFVAILAYLFFVIGLNLSGLFSIAGPANAGASLTGGNGTRGAFFTGALAVVVATPCTAPFMAAALGAALAMPIAGMLWVFVMLGLGFAAPFLLLTLVPGLGRRLPKPGAWMDRLKQGLAFPMYASAAWLVWVLALQVGADAILTVLIGGVLLAFGLWLALPVATQASTFSRAVGAGAAVIALALLALPATAERRSDGTIISSGETYHEPFSAEALAEARAAGQPAFVHMTAAWCITCQVNERVALAGDAFENAIGPDKIRYFVGDWTNEDAEITAYLEAFGRSGVPLYVVYPADGGAPELLPQILTPASVADAFARASAG